jgi:hypothetical protein
VESLAVSRIDPELAAQLLLGIEHLDPSGNTGPGELLQACLSGQCFGVATSDGQAQGVYVLGIKGDQARIRWARAWGAFDFTRAFLPAIERQCAQLQELAFQTSRPGLVRKATRQGYQVDGRIGRGWTLRKRLRP